MTSLQRLKKIFDIVLTEARDNPDFLHLLDAAMNEEATRGPAKEATEPPRGRRRTQAALNPYDDYEIGEQHLRERLDELSVEQLKDIVAEHGMDTMQLAMKWKSHERLKTLIAATVATRSRKGNAFTRQPAPVAEAVETGLPPISTPPEYPDRS